MPARTLRPMEEGLHYRSGAPEVQGSGSTVRRMQLGARLRALRLARG